jgi:hypothetical protein
MEAVLPCSVPCAPPSRLRNTTAPATVSATSHLRKNVGPLVPFPFHEGEEHAGV